jgi:hypothetical protein
MAILTELFGIPPRSTAIVPAAPSRTPTLRELEERFGATRAAYMAALEQTPRNASSHLWLQQNQAGEMTVGGLVQVENAKLAMETARLLHEHAASELADRRAERVQRVTLATSITSSLVALAALGVSLLAYLRPHG